MLRSGQPMCGTSQSRCPEDIQLLNCFLTNRSRGKVLDVRSPLLLQQHQSKGLVCYSKLACNIICDNVNTVDATLKHIYLFHLL